jgi:hypothetical protein
MADNGQPLIQILRTAPQPSSPASTHGRATVEWPAVADRLQQYADARARQDAVERCEVCGTPIEAEHGHIVNVPTRTLLCACRPCYLLFTHDGAGGARFRAVPQRYQLVPEVSTVWDGWDAFQIPIGLVFFFTNSATKRTTAFYPSPAGATESELPLDTWDGLAAAVPALASMMPDIEALIVRRRTSGAGMAQPPEDPGPCGDGGTARADDTTALIVPIDACYELVGRIRRAWRGFQGGDEVWAEIDGFFARASGRAREAAAQA